MRAEAIEVRGATSILRLKEEEAKKHAELLEAMRVRSELGLVPDPTHNVGPAPPPHFGPPQDEVNGWMVGYYREAFECDRQPPKRDDDAFPACRKAIGATHQQMVFAMREVPRDLKRRRGQRDR